MKTRNLSFGIIVSIVMISILFSGCCGLCQDPPPDPDDNWKPLNTTNNATQNNNITPPTNLTANNVTNQSININQTNQNSTYQNITFNGKNWTIMVYMDADNNLEGDGFKDLNEMEIAGSTDDVNIIVQMDRTEGWDTSNGDWTGAKRIYVEQDSSSQFRSKIIEDMGEVNMGDPYTLSSFIQWTTKNYPAENYMLILWDHGAGHEGLCWDNDNYDDYLELSELKSALQDGGTQFEVIGFDACLMSTLEIASIIDDHGQIMVASQESEPMDGWEYSSFLNKLKNNPDITSKQLSIEIINGFYNHYYLNPNARDITL